MSRSNLIKYKDKKGNTYPYLYIDTKTETFYVIKRIGLVVKKMPLGKEFMKARSMIFDAIAELSNEKKIDTNQKLIKDYYEIMIAEKKTIDIKESTLKRIYAVWEFSLKDYWGFLTANEINQDTVTNFITWHKRKRPSIQFVNAFKYLGNIFNVMIERGYLLAINKPKLTIPKDEQKQHDKQKGRYITDIEFKSILENVDQKTKTILLIAYCTGMRKMEILSLERSRVQFLDNRYIFKLDTADTKTGKARTIPIPEFLNQQIKDLYKLNSVYLFPMLTDKSRFMSGQLLDKEWVKGKRLANIKGQMRFHDLRHTAATNLARENINPTVAVTMLGMSLGTYQKAYLKLQTSDIIKASEANAKRLGFSI